MSIPFNCPHCGRFSEVENRFAGQRGPCAGCGEMITIPGGAASPFAAGSARSQYRPAAKKSAVPVVLIVLGVLALVSVPVVLILIVLLLPAVNAAREAARRNGCINNVRQIVLGIANHESATSRYPVQAVKDRAGQPVLSWRVSLLPYVEENVLFSRFKREEPWDSPANKPLVAEMPPVYRCPSDSKAAPGQTDYVVVTGEGTMFPPRPDNRGMKVGDMLDGTSKTIAVVEAHGAHITWSEPKDLEFSKMQFQPNGGPNELSSSHSGGVVVVGYADGHTQAIRNRIDPQVLKALLTRDGNERVNPDDL